MIASWKPTYESWRKKVIIYLTDLSTLEIYIATRGKGDSIVLSGESNISLSDPGKL